MINDIAQLLRDEDTTLSRNAAKLITKLREENASMQILLNGSDDKISELEDMVSELELKVQDLNLQLQELPE